MSHLVLSGTLLGIEGIPFRLIDLLRGLPSITIVGLPGRPLRRPIAFVPPYNNRDIPFPKKGRYQPCSCRLKKNRCFRSSHRLGILATMNKIPEQSCDDALFIGELSLSGRIRPLQGVLAFAIMAQKMGIKNLCSTGTSQKHPLSQH